MKEDQILKKDGHEYTGQCDLQDKRRGRGEQLFSDGSFYVGYWFDDMANGRGRRIYSNGEVYEGEWKDDKKHGQGKYTFVD